MKDFYSDNGALLSRLFATEGLPPILKEAEFIADPGDLQDLADNAFADPVGRSLPTYDKAATYASYAYYLADGGGDEAVEYRLKAAAGLFGLNEEIKRLGDVIASRKLADREKHEVEPWEISALGSRVRGTTPEEFSEAYSPLLSKTAVIRSGSANVREAAEAFVQKAAELGGGYEAGLPDDMYRLAGMGFPERNHLEMALKTRATKAFRPGRERNHLSKMATKMASVDMDRDSLSSLVDSIETFDRRHGLHRFYGAGMEDPLRTVHQISLRQAKTAMAKVKIGESEWGEEDLDTPRARKIAAHVLGDEGFSRVFPDGYEPARMSLISDDLARAFNQIYGG